MDLASLRAAFPAFRDGLAFMDWAATGLLSEPARHALQEYADGLASCATADATWMHGVHGTTRARVRALVAELIGAASNDIALVESTTAGLNAVALALPLSPGDNVVLSEIDYLAVATPWKARAAREGFTLRWVRARDRAIEVDDVLAACDDRTRVVALSSVCWTTGALLDLERLAPELAERDIALVLDAIQTFGVLPIDVRRTPVAAMTVGGHKWLGSLLGSGFLYVAPEIASRCAPPAVGFLSGKSARGPWWQWFEDPEASPKDAVEFPAAGRTWETGGTASYPGAIGLESSLSMIKGVGQKAIEAHARELGDRLMTGLSAAGVDVLTPRDPRRRGGMVVFQVPGGAEEQRAFAASARDARIAISVRFSSGLGGVRVSLHGPNDSSDVDRLLSLLRG